MAHARGRVLCDKDIEEELFNESDVGDFVPSDEDFGDVEYTIPSIEDPQSENSSSTESEPDAENSRNVQQGTQMRRTRRGQLTRRRGSCGRQRWNTNLRLSLRSENVSNWNIKSFQPNDSLRVREPSYLVIDTANFDNVKYFQRYIDAELINLLVEKTNQTSVKKTGRSLGLNVQECYTYIGITFLMASLNYPSLRMYWENKWRVDIIANAISRNRFIIIRNSLKLVFDNEVTVETRKKDKLWKVRPIIDKVQRGCRSQIKEQRLSIDEMIIPFTGSCGIKQYCPGKPNPVGVKAFVLANPNGMVCDFHIYEGSTTYPDYENTQFGLGEKVVLTLAHTLVPGHIIYCDRYFTSERLADELNNQGIGCTGTIVKNRIPRGVRPLLLEDKVLKRKGRGSSQVVVRNDDQLSVTKWFDNKAVTLLSSVEADVESDECQRWCKKLKRYITVTRPRVVREYNKYMGGVDVAGRLLAVCPNRYRTKKWTQRFIAHMLDLCVSNAWLQYKIDQIKIFTPQKKIDQLRSFKLQLGEKLIERNSNSTHVNESDYEIMSQASPNNRKRKRGMPVVPLPSKTHRTHHAKHLPIFSNQGRCRKCHLNKTYFACKTCNIRLCLTKKRNCYVDFHAENEQ